MSKKDKQHLPLLFFVFFHWVKADPDVCLRLTGPFGNEFNVASLMDWNGSLCSFFIAFMENLSCATRHVAYPLMSCQKSRFLNFIDTAHIVVPSARLTCCTCWRIALSLFLSFFCIPRLHTVPFTSLSPFFLSHCYFLCVSLQESSLQTRENIHHYRKPSLVPSLRASLSWT